MNETTKNVRQLIIIIVKAIKHTTYWHINNCLSALSALSFKTYAVEFCKPYVGSLRAIEGDRLFVCMYFLCFDVAEQKNLEQTSAAWKE